MQAIERTHLFAQPVLVPIIDRKYLFCLARDAAAEVGNDHFGRLAPQATEFICTTCHTEGYSFAINGLSI